MKILEVRHPDSEIRRTYNMPEIKKLKELYNKLVKDLKNKVFRIEFIEDNITEPVIVITLKGKKSIYLTEY